MIPILFTRLVGGVLGRAIIATLTALPLLRRPLELLLPGELGRLLLSVALAPRLERLRASGLFGPVALILGPKLGLPGLLRLTSYMA